jgi:hypothetical protein
VVIDTPPTNASSPPPPTHHTFGFIYVPSPWALDFRQRVRARDQFEKALNAKTILLPAAWPSDYPHQFMLEDFARANECAGCIIYRDLMQSIPRTAAKMLDFFFGRDKGEALVYEWRVWEKDFSLVDREWLNQRRRI